MIKLSDNCTGCGLCYAVCPQNAISQRKDELGFIYPIIDNELCIGCKLCVTTCPSSKNSEIKIENQCGYIACDRDKSNVITASSGGAFGAIVKSFFGRDSGIIYAVEFDDNIKLVHKRFIYNNDEWKACKKSKYTQSYMWDCFRSIKSDIEVSKVLVIGTPCQIAAVKQFIPNESKNLLLVDLLCTGVGSPRFLEEHIRLLNQIRKKGVSSYDMRYKSFDKFGRLNTMGCRIEYEDGTIESNEFLANMFRTIFGKHYFLRNSCYECKYKNINRVGDISIGDWWGDRYAEKVPSIWGRSVIIMNTVTAINLKDKLDAEMIMMQIDVNEIKNQQPSLRNEKLNNNSPRMKTYSHTEFRRKLFTCSTVSLWELSKIILKKILPVRIAKMFLNVQ